MASRRTFLKGVGAVVGASAVGGPDWALAAQAALPAVQHRLGTVFIGDAGPDPRVVCALVTTDVTRTRQMLRRAKRKLLDADQRAMSAVLQPGSVSIASRRLVYRLLSRIPPTSVGGFEIFSASVANASRWKSSETELYRIMVGEALEQSLLQRFKRVAVYVNTAWPPGASAVIAEDLAARFAGKFQSAGRFDVYPNPDWRHEGLQAARWAAFAIQQRLAGQTAEWQRMLRQHVRREISLAGV